MKFDDFILLINQERLNSIETKELLALALDKIGEWDKAHELIQWLPGKSFARIHAYLHRKEGDLWNANYWYSRAGEQMPDISLDDEWLDLAKRFCD